MKSILLPLCFLNEDWLFILAILFCDYVDFLFFLQFVMGISNPLRGVRKGGTVGKPFPGVQVSQMFMHEVFLFLKKASFEVDSTQQ